MNINGLMSTLATKGNEGWEGSQKEKPGVLVNTFIEKGSVFRKAIPISWAREFISVVWASTTTAEMGGSQSLEITQSGDARHAGCQASRLGPHTGPFPAPGPQSRSPAPGKRVSQTPVP